MTRVGQSAQAEAPRALSASQAAFRPILTWVGGKVQLLPALLRAVPATFGRYFEPFAGGAALFFRLAPSRATLADVEPGLIDCYRGVATDADAVIAELEQHAAKHCREHYLAVRGRWNAGARTAGAFLYMNRAGFNGLWRVNRLGECNVAFGRLDNPAVICRPDLLRAVAPLLARTELRCAGYAESTASAVAGDLVYLDPPYVPTSASSSFTSYGSGTWSADDHRALAAHAAELRARGCHVIASNSDTPLVRELYADWHLTEVSRAGAINSDPAKRGRVAELLITGTAP